MINDADGKMIACLGFIWGKTITESKANAAFICLAVNNHDKLIEALKELLRFKNVMESGADTLQYPDNFLAAIDTAKQLLKSIEQNI